MKQKVLRIVKDNFFVIITFIALFIKSSFVLMIINTGAKGGKYPGVFQGFRYMRSFQFLILPIILFLSFAYVFEGKAQIIYLLTINLFMSVLFIIDVWYYRGFSTPISILMYTQTANLDNTSSSIMGIIKWKDFLIFTDIIIVFAIAIMANHGIKFEFITMPKKSISCFLVAAIISVSIIPVEIFVFRAEPLKRFFRLRWNPRQTIDSLSPIGYHMFDTYQVFAETMYSVSNNRKKHIEKWYKDNNENLPDNKYAGMFKGKNLIIIQVESLENFVIKNKAYNQYVTPNINKLLAHSIYFPNYFELVGGGTSSDSDFMTNTSMYPLTNNSVFFTKPHNTYPVTLPKLMKRHGYNTIAIHPDKGYFWNWEPSLKNIGFDRCVDASHFKVTERIGLGISDKCYLNQVKPLITEEPQPFYSFMITLSSHTPFELPHKYRSLKLPKKLDTNVMGGYIQSIHYTDRQLGDFINYLDRSGTLDNSVLVMYGDHTGVHKYHSDQIKNLNWFPLARINNDKRVPLIIYSKGIKPKTVKTYCSQVDLMPTISYLMGVKDKDVKEYVMGKNALNTKRNYTIKLDGSMAGKYTKKDKKHMTEGLDNSQVIIRSNFFRKPKMKN